MDLEFEEDLHILAHDDIFSQCLNIEVSNYPNNDWGMILYFNDWDIKVFPALIKDFLNTYIEKYFDFFSKDKHKFTKIEHTRLSAFITKWMGTLEIDPTKRGDIDWALTILIAHWLHEQMYIFDVHHESIFPYPLNFKTRIRYTDEGKKPIITFKMQWKNVLLNDKILFDSNLYDDPQIITFLVNEEGEYSQIWDIYDYLYPNVWNPSTKEKKQLKDKIARMRKTILKNTWLDMFKSVGLRKVTLNRKVSVVIE